jgi:hypothetical protein
MSPLKRSRSDAEAGPSEKFETSASDWKPTRPTLESQGTTSARPLGRALGSLLMVTLGVALSLGASGCASVATAHAAQSGPQIVQAKTAPKREAAKATPAQQLQADSSASYKIGKGLNQVGQGVKEASQPALEKGKEVGQEVGKEAVKVGKEIGKAGKDFGLGVAKEATSFWKGLTGK